MKRKTGLFTIIMFVLLGILLITWFIPAGYFENGQLSDLGMYRVGFFDFFQLLFGSFQFAYFIQIVMLIVSVGALYGVLGKTGKYRALIERIASKFKGKELVFLITCALFIAALTSAFDYGIATFIFIPALVSIILAMNHSKITAFVATFGAYLAGIIGSTINESIVVTINSLLTDTTLSSGIWYKLALFVLSLGVIVFYLIRAKKVKGVKEQEDEDMFIGEKKSNKYSAIPIIVVFSILFVLLVLGCTGWQTVFGINIFTEFNTAITTWEIKGITVLAYILGTISPLGEWYYAEMSVMCLLASLLIGRLYGLKLKDSFAAMVEGAKKMLPSALLVCLTYAVVYFSGNTMFFPTIADFILGATSKFNLFLSSLTTALGSALHVDMLYVSNYVLAQIAATSTNHTLLALMFQSLYGLTMFIVPTSAMLVLGLSYLGISYKEWIKASWKMILELLVAIFVVLLIVMLI